MAAAGPAAAAMAEHGLAVADRVQVRERDLGAVAAVVAISPARGLVERVAHDPAADKSIGRKAIGHRTEICRIPVVLVRAFSAPVAELAVRARVRTLPVALAARVRALALALEADVHRKDN